MKKNRILFKAMAVMLALAFAFTAVPGFRYEAKAAEKLVDTIPAKVRISPKSVDNSAISIQLVQKGYKLTRLKSNSSNLKVYNTLSEGGSYEGDYGSEFNIGCYARKEGTYKVSYTLVNGKTKLNKTTVVYAKTDSAVKSAKFAGQRLDISNFDDLGDMARKDTGKFTVKMNKGYKLKSIAVKSYVKSQYSNDYDMLGSTTISNNATVTLSSQPYYDVYDYANDIYSHVTEYMVAKTVFEITYVDKYTKTDYKVSYDLYKLVRWAQ